MATVAYLILRYPLMRLVWVHSQRREPAEINMHLHRSAVGGVLIIHIAWSVECVACRSLLPSSMDHGRS